MRLYTLWGKVSIPILTHLAWIGAIGLFMPVPNKELLYLVAGILYIGVVLEFRKFTGPYQYISTLGVGILLALGAPYDMSQILVYLLPASLLLGVSLTVRQKYLHILTYTRYLWLEPFLVLCAVGFLLLLYMQTRRMPIGHFMMALPAVVLAGGYIQDAAYMQRWKRSGYAVRVGMEAPDFTLFDTENRPTSLRDYRGKNPVLLLFVRGDWCPGCHMMLRTYERYREKFQEKNVVILGIGPDPLDVNRQMIARLGTKFRMLSDPDFQVMKRYGTQYQNALLQQTVTGYDEGIPLPAAFLVDKEGIVQYVSSPERIGAFLDPRTIFPVLEKLEAGM